MGTRGAGPTRRQDERMEGARGSVDRRGTSSGLKHRLSPRSCAAGSPRAPHTSPVPARNHGEIWLDPDPCTHRDWGQTGVPSQALPSPCLCQLRARAAAAPRGPSKTPLNRPQKLISLSPCSPAEAEPRAPAQLRRRFPCLGLSRGSARRPLPHTAHSCSPNRARGWTRLPGPG